MQMRTPGAYDTAFLARFTHFTDRSSATNHQCFFADLPDLASKNLMAQVTRRADYER